MQSLRMPAQHRSVFSICWLYWKRCIPLDGGRIDLLDGYSYCLQKRLALGNGIQTVENHQQAWARANVENKNKGGGAASAALAMVKVRNELDS
jgi:hypothetical protein